ncbi:MAG TPA: IS5 family transposase [Chloroflexota bacterium]|nr:IS5 family transposase [Chloroflexota bacterium]
MLTDAAWAQLAPLLPPQKPRTGRPAKPHRTIVEGILWALRTGAPWRDLPERFGPWHTVASRFYRWVAAGVWDRVLAALQRRADAAGALDWGTHFVDGTVIRAHQHAAGARKRTRRPRAAGPADEALGRSRGGFSTKLHLRAEGGGKPMVLVLTAGQRHEQTAFRPLMERGAVKRRGRGRPRVRPDRVVGDRGYTGRPIRAYCRRRGIRSTIPRLRTERRAAYRERNRVERLVGRLKQCRRVATRYEKRAATFLAMVTLAAILLWL